MLLGRGNTEERKVKKLREKKKKSALRDSKADTTNLVIGKKKVPEFSMINSKNKKSQKRIIVEVIIDLATVQVAVWEIRIVGIC